MASSNLETVRRSQEAWQSESIEGLVADFAPDAEWVLAEENPNARTLRGREEISDYLKAWATMMPGLHYDVTENTEVGDTVVTRGSITARAGADGPQITVQLAFVAYFEGGQVVRTEEYLNPEKALAAAKAAASGGAS